MSTMTPAEWWNNYVDHLSALPEQFEPYERGDYPPVDRMILELSHTMEDYLGTTLPPEGWIEALDQDAVPLALDQICWSVRVDFELARSLLILADLTADEPSGLAELDPWIAVSEVVSVVRSEFDAVPQWAGGQFDPTDPGRIHFAAARITAASGTSLSHLAMAVVGGAVDTRLTALLDQFGPRILGSALTDSLNQLADTLTALASMALRAIMAAVSKLLRWVGITDDAVQVGGVSPDDLATWLVRQVVELLGGQLFAQALAVTFGRGQLVEDCNRMLDHVPQAADAVEAAMLALVKDVKRRQKAVDAGAHALGYAMKLPVVMASPFGPPALAMVAGLLALVSIWLAHDALDATRPFLLPDRVVGLTGQVRLLTPAPRPAGGTYHL